MQSSDMCVNSDGKTHFGLGCKIQWRIPGAKCALAYLMRLTTDVASLHVKSYKRIMGTFASDQEALDAAFGAAWFKRIAEVGGRHKQDATCHR